ncbi:MAG: 50S ribosomal protein L32e [Candidatus Helarchaeota archaeon]
MNLSARKKRYYLKLRKKIAKKRPQFRRYESWRYKKVKPRWRRPRGIDSSSRKKEKTGIKLVNIGYRSPKKVRGLHPSGFREVLVHNANQLEKLNSKYEAARIGSTVGILKRISILNRADELNIVVLNPGKALIQEEELVDLSTLEDEEEGI